MRDSLKYFNQISPGDVSYIRDRDLSKDTKTNIQNLLDRGFSPENSIEEKVLSLLQRRKNLDALRAWEEVNDQLGDYEKQRLLKAVHRILHTRISSRLDDKAPAHEILDPQIDRDFETIRQLGTLNPVQVDRWIEHLYATHDNQKADFLARAARTIFPALSLVRPSANANSSANTPPKILQENLLVLHYLEGNLEQAVHTQLSLVADFPNSIEARGKLENLILSVEAQAREALSEHLRHEDSQYGLRQSVMRFQSADIDLDSLSRISKMLKERSVRPMILVAFDMLRSDSFETAIKSAYAILRISPHNPDSWELAKSTAIRCIELASLSRNRQDQDLKLAACHRLTEKVELHEL